MIDHAEPYEITCPAHRFTPYVAECIRDTLARHVGVHPVRLWLVTTQSPAGVPLWLDDALSVDLCPDLDREMRSLLGPNFRQSTLEHAALIAANFLGAAGGGAELLKDELTRRRIKENA